MLWITRRLWTVKSWWPRWSRCVICVRSASLTLSLSLTFSRPPFFFPLSPCLSQNPSLFPFVCSTCLPTPCQDLQYPVGCRVPPKYRGPSSDGTVPLHLAAPHCTSLHLTAPHCTSLHLTAPRCTSLHLTHPDGSFKQHTMLIILLILPPNLAVGGPVVPRGAERAGRSACRAHHQPAQAQGSVSLVSPRTFLLLRRTDGTRHQRPSAHSRARTILAAPAPFMAAFRGCQDKGYNLLDSQAQLPRNEYPSGCLQ
jgi:hypothetical protein